MNRRMRFPYEIRNEFLAADPDTVIGKTCIRTILGFGISYSIRIYNKKQLADIDEFMMLFGADKNISRQSVPRIRRLEEAIILIKKQFQPKKLTINEITKIAHSGKVFIYDHGGRWILNYDELAVAVSEYIRGGEKNWQQ